MKIQKGLEYLDSDGRRFICNGFGTTGDLAFGWAIDPRPKRPRRLAAAYDDMCDRLGGVPAELVCQYPANDWDIVAFFSFERGSFRPGFWSTCELARPYVNACGGAA